MITCNYCKKEREGWYINSAGVCFDCLKQLAKIPELFRDKDYTNFRVSKGNQLALEKAHGFFKSKQGLFLFGGVGTGKTHLAVSILKEAIKLGFGIEITVMPNLFLRLRDSFKNGGDETESDIIQQFQRGLVLFDDFGTEKITNYTVQTVYTLINERYNTNQHKIIITSNISLQEIAENMLDKIASRICQMCQIVKIQGKDWRVK